MRDESDNPTTQMSDQDDTFHCDVPFLRSYPHMDLPLNPSLVSSHRHTGCMSLPLSRISLQFSHTRTHARTHARTLLYCFHAHTHAHTRVCVRTCVCVIEREKDYTGACSETTELDH